MPITDRIPATLIAEKNALNSIYPWLFLLDITLVNGTVLNLVNNNENITFNSITYTRFPFEIDARKEATKGEFPSVAIRVSNVLRTMQAYVEDLDGAIGSKVKLTLVNTKYLGTPSDYAYLEVYYDVLATKCDVNWVTFSLGAPYLTRRRFPLYRYIANHCIWTINFMGVECGYVSQANIASSTNSSPIEITTATNHGLESGDKVTVANHLVNTAANNTTSNPYWVVTKVSDTKFTLTGSTGVGVGGATGTVRFYECFGSLEDCQRRNNSAYFTGFVGLSRGGLRVVR